MDKNNLEQTAMDVAYKLEVQQIVGEKVPDAIVAINEEGIIIYFNYQATLMFEYKEEDIIGKHINELLPEGNRASHNKWIPSFFADPRDRPMALRQTLQAIDSHKRLFEVKIYLAGALSSIGKIGIAYVRRVLVEELNQASV